MKKFHIILVLFGFFMMPNTALRVEIQIVALCTMEMSSKTNKKDCCQRTLILKAKAQRLQWKMWAWQLPICKYSNTSLQSI
jgi:hypothetical protein